MELTRVFLLGALFLIGVMLWEAWENDYVKITPVTNVNKPAESAPFQPVSHLVATQTKIPAAKEVSAPRALISVKTDVLDIQIDPLGGNIVQANLIKYPKDLHSPQPYQLLNNNPETYYVAQSGLIGLGGPDTLQGQAIYKAEQPSYSLAPDQNQMLVKLVWKNSNGVEVTKQFTLKRDDYAINVSYHIENHSQTPWNGQFYAQLERKKVKQASHGLFGINPFVGAAYSSPEKTYQKLNFEKMAEQNLNTTITGGWAAMLEHYFLSAWVPKNTEAMTYYTHANDDLYTIGMLSSPMVVNPQAQLDTGATLYTGPEIMDRLKAIAPNLDLTVDYGILWFISIAIFWLMKQIYLVVGNWGWSIVLVTVLIKLVFYHLSAKSYRSMAAMRKLQPRLQALKERFGDDKQKLTQATMELYKTEKINPLGGCLPVIVQIPVFIALYWVLFESVELRQAPFILWIQDLSARDPYFILPIIMGVTMYVQQMLNPPPPDPMQAKMMQFLPVFFTFIFLSFPAGLVLYWVVNNSLSILQQWYIMRSVEHSEANKKRAKT